MRQVENSFGVRNRESQAQCFWVDLFICAITAEAETFYLQTAQRFLQRFLKGAPNRHRFTDAFHPCRQRLVCLRKFFEREARDFDDAVINRRFEAGRCLPCNVVFDLIECVTDGEFCRDLRDRKSGRLRSERARTRDARVHFDDDHAAITRINCELNIRSTGFHADLANDCERRITHHLVFFVGQRLRRRDGDGVAGMHSHRIEILDRADNYAVVHPVAHHLHLEFFPADE